MRPIFVIPAVGALYQSFAKRLVESTAAYGWDADFMLLDKEDDRRGRHNKTSFADALPDRASPIVLLDADCVATGPLALPEVSADVAAVRIARGGTPAAMVLNQANPFRDVFDTFMLVFPCLRSAKLVSAAWHAAWLPRGGMDMPAFNSALGAFSCQPIDGGTRSHPTSYIRHLVK